MKKLPEKPSALIRQCLIDIGRAEASSIYEISMSYWHVPTKYPDQPPVCRVCAAGAVMVFTLESLPTIGLSPDDFDEHTKGRLEALDEFRKGQIIKGLNRMGINGRDICDFEDLNDWGYENRCDYHQHGPAAFKSYFGHLTAKLESYGL